MKRVLLITLLLAGCGPQALMKPADCHLSPVCGECAPLPDWDGDLQSAPNLLAQYGVMYAQCADRGQACYECIDRLKKEKVLK